MQTALTHIDHLSGSGEGGTLVDLGGYGLVDRPDGEGREESDQRSTFLIHRMILQLRGCARRVSSTYARSLADVSLLGASLSQAAARKKHPKASVPAG